MPLAAGNDRATISNNIREMIASGHPQRVAVAAALSNADRHPSRSFGGSIPHRDDGGMVPQIGGPAPTAQTANPNVQSIIQRFSAMSPEQLQETTTRLRGSPLGLLAQKVLQQKRIMPQPGQTPQMGGVAAPVSPVSQVQMPQVPGDQAQGFAAGGDIGMGMANPWWTRREATSADSGFIHSSVPGRTDHIAASPAADSFVVPADVVSGTGEGNSLAGARILQLVLGTGPHGIPLPHNIGGSHIPRPPRALPTFDTGGVIPRNMDSRGGKPETVDIMAAGGELIVPPGWVHYWGGGDVARGHKRLEAWVVHQRKKNIEDQKKLKGPVKS